MKKLLIAAVTCVALVSLLVGGLVAAGDNSQPASKATAKVSTVNLIDQTDTTGGWQTILMQKIKTPNQKDLFIDVSLESGLYTRTLVKSKRNYEGDPDWDSSTAHGTINVQVLVDGVPAAPGAITFNDREQTLSAKFMGIFTGDSLIITDVLVDTDGDGSIDEDPTVDGIDQDGDGLDGEDPIDYEQVITIDYETLEPEELELVLETMSANSFNFVVADLESGVHTICVQAMIETNGSAEEGEWEAYATIGRGSVTIESVRMIQDEDWLIPEIVD